MLDAWGDRRISLVRELTKIHEEVIRTTLKEAAARYDTETPKGEFVLVIEGAEAPKPAEYTQEDALRMAREWMDAGLSASEAAKKAAVETGLKKGEIYKIISREPS